MILAAIATAAACLTPAGGAYASDGPRNQTDDEWYVCKTYHRGSRAIPLRYGMEYHQSGGWGYEHIKAGHGWSNTRDSWINVTLQAGAHPRRERKSRGEVRGETRQQPGG